MNIRGLYILSELFILNLNKLQSVFTLIHEYSSVFTPTTYLRSNAGKITWFETATNI